MLLDNKVIWSENLKKSISKLNVYVIQRSHSLLGEVQLVSTITRLHLTKKKICSETVESKLVKLENSYSYSDTSHKLVR